MPVNFSKKKSSRPRCFRVAMALITCIGAWLFFSALYQPVKAHLAQHLIAGAWKKTINTGNRHKPWSWADTHPVAKLKFPRLSEELYVLAGASGRNMAFGPAHSQTSGMPGENLSTVISAHRDSHFKPLKQLKLNDVIEIQTLSGTFTYVVSDLQIKDSRKEKIALHYADQLILTTCYPFDALTSGGPMRYQIIATPLNSNKERGNILAAGIGR